MSGPRLYFHLFAKYLLIKNIFEEEEKSLMVQHDYCFENSSLLGVFWLFSKADCDFCFPVFIVHPRAQG